MAIRQDESIELILPSVEQFNNKSDIRNYLITNWISEAPGTKYRYFVESLSNNSRIYLERPGRLNKGCDFVIYIEGLLLFLNGNDKPPKHGFLTGDLSEKKRMLSKLQWQAMLAAIQEIHNTGTYGNAIQYLVGIPQHGLSYETVLKLARWFFIEQDITYWARSGRDMLFNEIWKI